VLPSQVVAFVDAAIPDAARIQAEGSPLSIDYSENAFLRALSELIERMDEILLPTGEEYVTYVAAVSAIDAILNEWQSRDVTRPLKRVPGTDENPVITIRKLLENCPDQRIPDKFAGFEFITDDHYRRQLLMEMLSVEDLLKDSQWKAVMVMASSLMEAIFCECLMNVPAADLEPAVQAAIDDGAIRKNTKGSPENWNLPTYVHVARQVGLITERTKQQALLAGDYRNLVHPGKTRREAVTCNRATALSVVAGLEHVVDDIERTSDSHCRFDDADEVQCD
jgi:hypothetical protein